MPSLFPYNAAPVPYKKGARRFKELDAKTLPIAWAYRPRYSLALRIAVLSSGTLILFDSLSTQIQGLTGQSIHGQ